MFFCLFGTAAKSVTQKDIKIKKGNHETGMFNAKRGKSRLSFYTQNKRSLSLTLVSFQTRCVGRNRNFISKIAF